MHTTQDSHQQCGSHESSHTRGHTTKRTERNLVSHGDGNVTNKCFSSHHVDHAHVTLASGKPKCKLLYVIKGDNTSNKDDVSKENRDADNGANGEKKDGGNNTAKNGDQIDDDDDNDRTSFEGTEKKCAEGDSDDDSDLPSIQDILRSVVAGESAHASTGMLPRSKRKVMEHAGFSEPLTKRRTLSGTKLVGD